MPKQVLRVGRPTLDDIQNLAELFERSNWTQMRFKMGGVDVLLTNDSDRPSLGHSVVRVLSTTDTPAQIPAGLSAIRAPNVATFYGSSAVGAASYVVEGDEVDVNTEVCRIEVLGTSTVLRAGVKGVVREICMADGELAEFNVPLILVEPAAA